MGWRDRMKQNRKSDAIIKEQRRYDPRLKSLSDARTVARAMDDKMRANGQLGQSHGRDA